MNGGQNICSRDASVGNVGNGKNFERQAQSSKTLYNITALNLARSLYGNIAILI